MNIYQEFHAFFSVRMIEILRHAREDGNFTEAWNKGLIKCIPKTARASTVEKLHPIALQQLKKKWFMTALLMQVEDILRQITPLPPNRWGASTTSTNAAPLLGGHRRMGHGGVDDAPHHRLPHRLPHTFS